MASYLFIVSREHPVLHDYLLERFAGDSNVQVILDRRRGPDHADRPLRRATPGADRRVRTEVEEEIRSSAHAIVAL